MEVTENITVLFTDLVGSTQLANSVTPGEADAIRRQHFDTLRTAISDADGAEIKCLGDGIMAVFASPSAALSCAAMMQQAVHLDNKRTEHPLSLRIGLSTGEATKESDDYFGDPVIEAARLCAKAEGGQILAAWLVPALAGRRNQLDFNSLGKLDLKGLREPLETVEVLWLPIEYDDNPAGVPFPRRLSAISQVFFGRESERSLLAGALKETRADSQPRIALIGGEPGIGKTSLAAVASRAAHEAGATVLYGRCDEGLGIPYQPWREALAHLIDHAPPNVEQAIAERSGILATLGLGPDALTEAPLDPDMELYALFGAILGVLEAAAHPEGLVLLLDDIHGADVQSLQLLRRVASRTISMPMLVMATYRVSEVTSGSVLSGLLADLHREPGVTRLGLSGLGDLELLSLLESMAGHSLEGSELALRDALLAETDGNPFFVGELLRHLAETGALFQDESGRWAADPNLGLRGLPTSLREVIGERVARLGDPASRALSVASVIGRDFDLDVLAESTAIDTSILLDSMDLAITASLVTDLGDGRFSFTHALVERALYDQLGPSRRAYAHLKVAEAIEQLSGSEPGRAAELARHWMMATIPQDSDKAVTYAKRAADHALAGLAPDEARRWYKEALHLLDQQAQPETRLQCELLVGLGDAERQCGDPAHRSTLLKAAHMAIPLGDVGMMGRAALANTRGFFSDSRSTDLERVEILEVVAQRTVGRRDELRARVLALLAAENALAGEYQSRREMADEALTIARELADPVTLSSVLNHRIVAVYSPAVLAELLHNTEEALFLAERVGNPILLGYAAAFRFFVAWQAVDRREADRMWRIMDELSARIGQPIIRWILGFLGAQRATIDAEFDEAERLAEQALEVGIGTGQPDAFNIYGAQILRLGRERDVATDFIPVVEGVLKADPTNNGAKTMLARLYCDVGRLDDARATVAPYIERDCVDFHWGIYWVTSMELLADTVADLDWTEAANSMVVHLRPWAAQWDFVAPSSNGPVARPLGRLLATMGSEGEADQKFRLSLDISEAVNSPLHIAHTCLDWGRALVSRSDPAEMTHARALLGRAESLATIHGLSLVGRLTAECLSTIG